MTRRASSPQFFFSSRRRHTRLTCDWSSDVCSSDLQPQCEQAGPIRRANTQGAALVKEQRGRALAQPIDPLGIGQREQKAAQDKEELHARSEERRVGKERRREWEPTQDGQRLGGSGS